MDIREKRRGPRTKSRGTPMFRSQGREEETAMKTGKLVAGELRVKPEECGVVKAK